MKALSVRVIGFLILVLGLGMQAAMAVDLYPADVINGYTFQNDTYYYLRGNNANFEVNGFFEVQEGATVNFKHPLDNLYHTMVVQNLDEGENATIGSANGDEVQFINCRNFQIIGEKVYIAKTHFESYGTSASDLVYLADCPQIFITNGCEFIQADDYYALVINGGGTDLEFLAEPWAIRILNTTIQSVLGGGIRIYGTEETTTLKVEDNYIFTLENGIILEDGLTNTNDGWDGDANLFKYPMIISRNNIRGNSVSADIDFAGINIDDTPFTSILICNNNVYNFPTGILSRRLDGGNNACPHIFNNSVFDCQIGIRVDDIFDDDASQTNGLWIRNNVIWESVSTWGRGYAVYLEFDGDATMNDIDFYNNIIGESSQGIRIISGLGVGVFDGDRGATDLVKYNAFKSNNSDCVYNGSANDGATLLSSCLIHDAGDDNPWIEMSNENPGSNGWDFHINMDDVEGNDDFNMDLVNSAYAGNIHWADPGYDAIGRVIRNLNGMDHIPASYPDMGIYGGPYGIHNINLAFEDQEDWIYWSDDVCYSDMPEEYYYWIPPLGGWGGGALNFGPGTVVYFGDNVINMANVVNIDGDPDTMAVSLIFDTGGYLSMSSSTDLQNSNIEYLTVYNADYGLYLSGLDNSQGYRLSVSNSSFIDCGVGIYANNSRLHLEDCEITGSTGDGVTLNGNGVYLSNCSAGKVIIEDCDVSDNGSSATVSGAGIYLSSSSPEILWTDVKNNMGAGITCYSSTPDLDTWDVLGLSDRPNSIEDNGSVHSGSDGSEIYLGSSSYPTINYNNIVDYSGGPVGYMIYKDPTTNGSALNAKSNYWGGTPGSNFFYWGSGSAIDYSNYSGTRLSSAEELAAAMGYWDRGEFAEASNIFRECAMDTGAIGVKSIHYLSGCVGEMEEGDFADLRDFLLGVASEQQDERVAWIAQRFATNCLTELGQYDDAMEEYDQAQQDASCLSDSVMAAVDWLAVYELSNGGNLDAAEGDIPSRMAKAFERLAQSCSSTGGRLLPTEFTITSAFPNPFNASIMFGYTLPEASAVNLAAFDLQGREVATLVNSRQEPGNHSVVWNATEVPTGVYMVRMEANGHQASRMITLLK